MFLCTEGWKAVCKLLCGCDSNDFATVMTLSTLRWEGGGSLRLKLVTCSPSSSLTQSSETQTLQTWAGPAPNEKVHNCRTFNSTQTARTTITGHMTIELYSLKEEVTKIVSLLLMRVWAEWISILIEKLDLVQDTVFPYLYMLSHWDSPADLV